MTKADAALPPPVLSAERLRVTRDGRERGARAVPEETAVSFTYGRATYAVMMATPQDLEDFAIGFSLTEGIVRRPGEIAELDVVSLPLGIELRITLSGARGEALEARRRTMAGPAGCGLCGIESLEAAVRKPARVESDVRIAPETVFRVMRDLRARQPLNAETHAVHAAGFWPFDGEGFAAVREDVGRHNALDKLVGALARNGRDAAGGIVALTSRVSIELVQKAAAIGCPVIAAVSAPTGYAMRAAEEAGLTLVAVARDDSFEIFTHSERIAGP
jgi:FdhD protein